MTANEPDAPLTEPVIVSETLVAGMEIEVVGDIVHFVGWAHVPSHGGETQERRVVERFAMQFEAARDCCKRVHFVLFGPGPH